MHNLVFVNTYVRNLFNVNKLKAIHQRLDRQGILSKSSWSETSNSDELQREDGTSKLIFSKFSRLIKGILLTFGLRQSCCLIFFWHEDALCQLCAK